VDVAPVTRRAAAASGAFVAVLLGIGAWSGVKPGQDRDWIPDHRVPATAELRGDSVVIRNLRDFRYTAGGEAEERYDERAYDLGELTGVSYVLVPFSRSWRGPAHSFLSFGFADGRHISISVEARREHGETYSLLRGMLKRFELMYVVGDERDLITLRAVKWGDAVHVYPIRATPEQRRSVLLSMLERANALAAQPEFYHTLTNNCTTNILAHVNEIAERRIAFSWRLLLPGYSDAIAFQRGLLDTDLDLDAARQRFNVTERAVRWADAADFSLRIRADDA
jgi:hypothetical protein